MTGWTLRVGLEPRLPGARFVECHFAAARGTRVGGVAVRALRGRVLGLELRTGGRAVRREPVELWAAGGVAASAALLVDARADEPCWTLVAEWAADGDGDGDGDSDPIAVDWWTLAAR